MELHSAVEAKCTTAGNVAYYYCEDCHGYFDADGNPISTIVTPALGHNWSEWATTSPSCTEDGSVKRHCTREGCYETISVVIPAYGHNWGEWKIVKFPTETEEGLIRRLCLNDSSHNQEVPIPKGHHELVKVSRLEPTCEKDGNIEYWYCSICGRIFSDEQGTTEISFAETILPAVGHQWETTYTWAEDYSSLTASHTCSVCKKTESETVSTTIEIIKEPTGSEEGEMKVTSAAFQNPDFEPQTITVALPLYRFTEGMNAVWTKGSKEQLVFRVNRSSQDNETARRFTSVLVDERTVDPGKYETASGSIIIRLKTEYLESLYTGDHSISVTFNDGTANPVIFTIKGTTPSPEPPVPSDAQGPSGNKPGTVRVVDTSDRTNLALWLTLLLVSSMLSVFSGSCLLKDHYLREK
ncbi:MAG: hypothetical protein IKG37_02240 [Solobacterium sp.]|nr:hypothetical protein [Solobacterium sp.]